MGDSDIQKLNRVALFGGAFDPPHVGHALAIRQILDTALFDSVWVVPTSIRPDKVSAASDEDRQALVQALIDEMFPLEDVQLRTHLLDAQGKLQTTIDELRYLSKTYPECDFTVAIGRDQAEKLSTWNAFEELTDIARFLVIARDGKPVELGEDIDATLLNPSSVAWMAISSTDIRSRLRANKDIEGMVPRSVLDLITNRHLYHKEET